MTRLQTRHLQRLGTTICLALALAWTTPSAAALAGEETVDAGATGDAAAPASLDTTDEQRRLRALVADAIAGKAKKQRAALEELARIGNEALPLSTDDVDAMTARVMQGEKGVMNEHRGTIDFVLTKKEYQALDDATMPLMMKAIETALDDPDASVALSALLGGVQNFKLACWVGSRPAGAQFAETSIQELVEQLINAAEDEDTVGRVMALARRGSDPRPIREVLPTPHIEYIKTLSAQFVKESALAETDEAREAFVDLEEGLAELVRRLEAGPE